MTLYRNQNTRQQWEVDVMRSTALAEASRFWALHSPDNPLVGSSMRRAKHLQGLYGFRGGMLRNQRLGSLELRAAIAKVKATAKQGRA